MRTRVAFAVVCAGLFVIAGSWNLSVSAVSASAQASSFASNPVAGPATWSSMPLGSFSKIQHVIILMMENRAYDNYFGVYCQQKGPHCARAAVGIPAGTCVPQNPALPTSPCIAPFNLTPATYQGLGDLPHTWESSHRALNNGSMNGFYAAESYHNYTFGHYNGSTIPTYWDMAQEFGLSDEFFSSTLTYSLPNHWFLVAGQSPQILLGSTITSNKNITARHDYLNQANVTPSIAWELMNHSSVSWNYYDFALAPYAQSITDLSGDNYGSAYLTWSPLSAQNESYLGSAPSHFKNRTLFFSDLTSKNLGNISYIIPDASYSDHLPANVTYGEDYVASVVNAVESSSYWNNTAVFVTWDEYGGWYDNVAPPQIDADGLGFRVPLLVFSPWTTPGYIGTHTLSFDSLLAFVEWRWNLGCLTPRDCTATLPVGFFNFGIHRPPVYFGSANDSVYPYVPPPGPPYIETPAQLNSEQLPIPPQDDSSIDWS